MTKFDARALLFGLTVMLAGPVFAQSTESTGTAATSQAASEAEKAVATVRTDGGVVMVSEQNGAFSTAVQNQPVVSGDRLMVAKESVATVIYNDGCEQKYSKAGIYKIEPDCKRALGGWTGSKPKLAGMILGGAALGAVVEKQFCHCKCPPVSH
ncbi:MAG TPA: hypothetical protein VFN09_03875 [Rhodanobacteraceae bacterium]|nr:hypothetical protein [Rhodanobacteraceae bacterium]